MRITTIIALILMAALYFVGTAQAEVGVQYPGSWITFSGVDTGEEGFDPPDVPVITSGREGPHIPDSLHTDGYAIDLRVRNLTKAQAEAIAQGLREQLGRDYDVILDYRGKPYDHIHLEYDPD